MSTTEEGASATAEVHAIGISFGNSNSSIAYTSVDGKAEVIANEEGDRQIPSILSYVEGEEFHGTQAKTQFARNSQNTVAYFRDFLGKSFDSIDPTNCHASAHPKQHNSTIAFSIKDIESEPPNDVTVSEIATRHLRRLAASASDYLGKKINAAVITVPTDFTEEQKAALSEAANEAGIEVLQMIAEPTAAVLAYDARPEATQKDKFIILADLGGTRTDIAVIASRGGMYSLLSTTHDYEFAGSQLDQVLIDHFAKEFVKKNKKDPRENPRSLAKLKLEAEATKKALSLGANASCSIESLVDGIDFSSTINRTRYEMLAGKVFGHFTRLIEEVVKKADLDVLDIDEIILAGGTSHTPRIATNLARIFDKATIIAPSMSTTALDPSTLTARGAAFQASLIEQFDKEDIEQNTHPMCTATPHVTNTIGVMLVSDEISRGIFTPLIEREMAVPCRRTGHFAAPKTGGNVLVKVCEGICDIKTIVREKVKTNRQKDKADEEDDDCEDDEDDEPETVREKVWKVGSVLAEAAVKDVKKGGKVEVTIDVLADMTMSIAVREIGSKGGVRGKLEKEEVRENGNA